jgi:hypothetical protein
MKAMKSNILFFVAAFALSILFAGCDDQIASKNPKPKTTSTNTVPLSMESVSVAKPTEQLKREIDYDARRFLSNIEVVDFNRVYPKFDEERTEKNWEWKDVDPLGLFTPAENRQRRRDIFVFEITPKALLETDGKPSPEQDAYKKVIEVETPGIIVLISHQTAKILSPYSDKYEKDDQTFRESLLTRTAIWGLRWAQVGGANLYVYNGNVLISRFSQGYVALPSLVVDNPFSKQPSSGSLHP